MKSEFAMKGEFVPCKVDACCKMQILRPGMQICTVGSRFVQQEALCRRRQLLTVGGRFGAFGGE